MPRPKVAYSRSHAHDIAASLQRERPDLNQADYLYLLYAQRVGRILDAVDDRHCREDFGISAAEMRVLYALRRAGPPHALRPTELFRSLLVTSGAITKQVDRLSAAGYVDRQPGPDRSGGFLIHLTDKGVQVADDALTALADSSVISRSTLTAKERETVCQLLAKMLRDLEGRLHKDDPEPGV
ncbi:MAG TPA: MarR family transcriptional regulator [Phenylobacterium sp.]|nr:MarR family transcriptional regulator [Phenylobacterium sp.]